MSVRHSRIHQISGSILLSMTDTTDETIDVEADTTVSIADDDRELCAGEVREMTTEDRLKRYGHTQKVGRGRVRSQEAAAKARREAAADEAAEDAGAAS